MCRDSYDQFLEVLQVSLSRLRQASDRCLAGALAGVASEVQEGRAEGEEAMAGLLESVRLQVLARSRALGQRPGCPTFEGSAANDAVF